MKINFESAIKHLLHLFLLLTLVGCSSNGKTMTSLNDLDLNLLPTEDGRVVLSLVNRSDVPLCLNCRGAVGEPIAGTPDFQDHEFEMNVVGDSGPLPFAVDIKPVVLKTEHFKNVNPGERVEFQVKLGSYFGVSQGSTYQVSASYRNVETGEEFSRQPWIGQIKSDGNIKVTVTE